MVADQKVVLQKELLLKKLETKLQKARFTISQNLREAYDGIHWDAFSLYDDAWRKPKDKQLFAAKDKEPRLGYTKYLDEGLPSERKKEWGATPIETTLFQYDIKFGYNGEETKRNPLPGATELTLKDRLKGYAEHLAEVAGRKEGEKVRNLHIEISRNFGL